MLSSRAVLHQNVVFSIYKTVMVTSRLLPSAGKVQFGSGSGPLVLNAKLECHVRFRSLLNLEPEHRFGLRSNSNDFGHLGQAKWHPK